MVERERQSGNIARARTARAVACSGIGVLHALALLGCAAEAALTTASPSAASPRAALVFPVQMPPADPAAVAWLASRNDASLAPDDRPRLLTTAWPEPEVRREARRVPTIYSRWGRSF